MSSATVKPQARRDEPHRISGGIAHSVRRSNEDRRLIESIRAVLAIVAGLLMLDTPSSIQNNLSIGVLAFGAYACGLLWFAANGSRFPMLRILHWIDACWFLLFIALSQEIGVRYFLFLFFPVLFASWRRGFGESTSVAVFSGLSAMCLFGLLTPEISWTRLLALPLSLLIIGPLVAVLTRVEATTQQGFTFAARLVDSIDPQRGFETIMPPILEHIAREFGATAALLVIRSFEGGNRVLCWEESEACSELSESAATPLAERILAFPSEQAFAFRTSSRWWRRENVQAFAVYGSHLEPVQPDHAAIRSLADLLEHPTLMSVPLPCRSIGSLRLVLSGAKVGAKPQELDILIHIIEQLGPTIEKSLPAGAARQRSRRHGACKDRPRSSRQRHPALHWPQIRHRSLGAPSRVGKPHHTGSGALARHHDRRTQGHARSCQRPARRARQGWRPAGQCRPATSSSFQSTIRYYRQSRYRRIASRQPTHRGRALSYRCRRAQQHPPAHAIASRSHHPVLR